MGTNFYKIAFETSAIVITLNYQFLKVSGGKVFVLQLLISYSSIGSGFSYAGDLPELF